jgi:hypothetical protein
MIDKKAAPSFEVFDQFLHIVFWYRRTTETSSAEPVGLQVVFAQIL